MWWWLNDEMGGSANLFEFGLGCAVLRSSSSSRAWSLWPLSPRIEAIFIMGVTTSLCAGRGARRGRERAR